MRAVVADADGDRAVALREELERFGHDVTVVQGTEDVLREALDEQPIVVLGAQGDDDAVALCRALTQRPEPEGPVVVLVGGPGEVDVDAALAAGAADVWVLDDGRLSAVDVRVALAKYYARLQAENLRVGGEFALMRQALDLSGTGFVLSDPRLEDDPIVYANRSFLEMTGYSEEDVVGHNCRFLQGPSTDAADVARIRRALRDGRPVSVELVNHRKDGTPFFNELHIAPVRDDRGDIVRHVGVQLDVTGYRVRDQLYALEQRARRAAEAAERRSSFLAAASPALDARLDLRATLESLAKLSVPHLGDVCLVETVTGHQVRRVAASATDGWLERRLLEAPASFELESSSPLARVLGQGRAEIVDRPGLGAAVHALLDGYDGGAQRHWMLVPLRTRGRTIGVLAVAGLADERRYGVDELALAQDLASRAALALDNARLYEQQVEVAAVLQASFLPDELPVLEGLELASRYRPADAAVDIGGDFYDVLQHPGGASALVVGDVTGKGAPAAALTGLCRHTLRTAWSYEDDPFRVLERLNAALVAERRERGRYATAVVAALTPLAPVGGDAAASGGVAAGDVAAGGVEAGDAAAGGAAADDAAAGGGAAGRGIAAEVVCAGHPAPLVLRAGGAVETLGATGTILGWREEIDLRRARGTLAPGDTLVLFTDGVSAGDPSSDAFAAELARCAGLSLDETATRLQAAAVRAQAGSRADDVVIVLARAT